MDLEKFILLEHAKMLSLIVDLSQPEVKELALVKGLARF